MNFCSTLPRRSFICIQPEVMKVCWSIEDWCRGAPGNSAPTLQPTHTYPLLPHPFSFIYKHIVSLFSTLSFFALCFCLSRTPPLIASVLVRLLPLSTPSISIYSWTCSHGSSGSPVQTLLKLFASRTECDREGGVTDRMVAEPRLFFYFCLSC